MKKKVSDFVKSLGATTSYSGKRKTMYIKVSKHEHWDIEMSILDKFGFSLRFRLSTQNL